MDDWSNDIRAELGRLGCVHADDPDHENCIDVITLWDERQQAWQLPPGWKPRHEIEAAEQAQDEYNYLMQHGYEAYWIWMRERDSFAGVPWAFYLDGEPTISDRLLFSLAQVDAVLACLDALPDGCGVHQVWAALCALPSAGDPAP